MKYRHLKQSTHQTTIPFIAKNAYPLNIRFSLIRQEGYKGHSGDTIEKPGSRNDRTAFLNRLHRLLSLSLHEKRLPGSGHNYLPASMTVLLRTCPHRPELAALHAVTGVAWESLLCAKSGQPIYNIYLFYFLDKSRCIYWFNVKNVFNNTCLQVLFNPTSEI